LLFVIGDAARVVEGLLVIGRALSVGEGSKGCWLLVI